MHSNNLRLNRRAVLTGAAALGGLSLLPRRARAADHGRRAARLAEGLDVDLAPDQRDTLTAALELPAA